MKEFKILTTDGHMRYMLSNIIATTLTKYSDTLFRICDATIDHVPEPDLYFLSYQHPFKDFDIEVMGESPLNLYANSRYLENKNPLKTVEDIKDHTVIKLMRANVLLKFGGVSYKPIYEKEKALEVDSVSSLITLAEQGIGIISTNDFLVKHANLDLEKLPEITETTYIKHTLGVHKNHKNNPIFLDMREQLAAIIQH